MTTRRFKVCDELGVIRTFLCKQDAEYFLRLRPEFKLVVEKKPKIVVERFDVYSLGDALF